MPTQETIEFHLPKVGLTIELVELPVSKMITAMKTPDVAKARSLDEAALYIGAETLRMSLVKINGEPVRYIDLQGDNLTRRLGRVRYLANIVYELSKRYAPSTEDVDRMEKRAMISVEDFVEVWKVTLPDGRTVVLEEVGLGTLGDALGEAQQQSRNEAAAEVLATIANLKRSIRSVDGEPVEEEDLTSAKWDRLFSLMETRLLGQIFDRIHSGIEDIEVGEAKPVDGTRSPISPDTAG